MKLLASSFWANCLALYYYGHVKYYHINANGYWEYSIEDAFGEIIYQTKGLK